MDTGSMAVQQEDFDKRISGSCAHVSPGTSSNTPSAKHEFMTEMKSGSRRIITLSRNSEKKSTGKGHVSTAERATRMETVQPSCPESGVNITQGSITN